MFTCNIDMPLQETNNCAITLAAAVQSSPQFVDFIDDFNNLYPQNKPLLDFFSFLASLLLYDFVSFSFVTNI